MAKPGSSWTALGEGEAFWFLGTLATIRVPGEAVDDRFALIEFLFPLHASPPLHTHPQDESYVVLDGRLTIKAGDQRFQVEAGGAAGVPMGVPHTLRGGSETGGGPVVRTPPGLGPQGRGGSRGGGGPWGGREPATARARGPGVDRDAGAARSRRGPPRSPRTLR